MPRFLVEVPHPEEIVACAKVVQVFLSTGSHFLSHADWGCGDGVHSAFFTIEADSKEEARLAVPPPFRHDAKIVGLNKFTLQEMEQIIATHPER